MCFCHMPTQTYMEVDPRRDHSMRVPRPDLSEAVHAPNACTMCHTDKDNAWATAATRIAGLAAISQNRGPAATAAPWATQCS